MTKEIQILQQIADTGRCDTLPVDACFHCPLSKLKKRPNGIGWLSCLEAIAGSSFENIKEKYKEAARAKLLEIAIEEIISQPDKSEKDK